MLEAVLLAAGLVAGVTGAWSPCGFSMVDTLAPHGYAGRLRTTLVACATFAAGALAGGVATFGGLALLGEALGAGGAAALAVAAAVALAAAAGEARGARIVPQVRRQVPESWRRVLPLPLAAGLYGVLLGLGFTTFILSFAVWALAGVSVALGDPALGLLVGLGFGVGRTLPVVVLAPLARHRARRRARTPRWPSGRRSCARCAPPTPPRWPPARPRCGPRPRRPRPCSPSPATDPSADGALVAFQRARRRRRARAAGRRGQRRARRRTPRSAAAGSPGSATGTRRGPLARPTRRTPSRCRRPAPTPSPSRRLGRLARERGRRATRCSPRRCRPRRPRAVAARAARARRSAARRSTGDRLLFHVAGAHAAGSSQSDLATGAPQHAAPAPRALLLNPSSDGGRLLYVRSTFQRQQLRIGPLRARRSPRATARSTAPCPTGRRDAGHEPGDAHNAARLARRSSRRARSRGVS